MQLRSVPSVAVLADRAGEEIAIVGRGALHHVGVEAPAFSKMHSGIDPQRHPRIGAHALTLCAPTDTQCPRPPIRAHRTILRGGACASGRA